MVHGDDPDLLSLGSGSVLFFVGQVLFSGGRYGELIESMNAGYREFRTQEE
jgi:hypothetical protein